MFSGLVFVFFSVSRSKLIPYVLPIWPALAVLLALGIERARAKGAAFHGERIATGVLFGALLAAGTRRTDTARVSSYASTRRPPERAPFSRSSEDSS